jgi:peptidoglycan-N-acetylglucosamine deacetylase
MSEQLFGRRIPEILLIHDGAFQLLMFDAILKHWRASGVQFISLKQALADPAYKINPNEAHTGGHTFLGQVAEARAIGIGALEPQKYSIERLNAVCAAPPSPTH